MWWQIVIVTHVVSMFIMMTRWSKRYISGYYKQTNTPHADEAWWGHFVLGLFPIVGFPYAIGDWLAKRELKQQKREKELERVQDDVRKMLS